MRFFKPSKINWKYILGELLLIFLGINLAIWFNDWNAANKTADNMEIALLKINEEIQNNLEELQEASEANHRIPQAMEDYIALPGLKNEYKEVSRQKMREFQQKYPGFFLIKDSTELNDSTVRYTGDTRVNLELISLSQIAWETTKQMGIANDFGYDCLYDLEDVYSLQDIVQLEVNKAANALQNHEIQSLLRILEFLKQLDMQLIDAYKEMLTRLDSCR